MNTSITHKKVLSLLTFLFCFLSLNAASVDVDGITYSIRRGTATIIAKSDGSKYSGDIDIPDEIVVDSTIYEVRSMHTDIFKDCPKLTSVTFGANIRPMRSCSFASDTALVSVTFRNINHGNYSSLTSSFDFNNCISLEKVTYPSEFKNYTDSIYFPAYAFMHCRKLTALENLPNNAAGIGVSYQSFFHCESLDVTKYLNFSKVFFYNDKNAQYETSQTFSHCNITKLVIPESMTVIPDYTFTFNPLTEVTLHNNIISIGDNAFYCDTYSLNTLTLYEGAKSLGYMPFKNLRNLNLPSTFEELDYQGFLDNITVADGNKKFFTKDHALYEYLDNGEIMFKCIFGSQAHEPFVWNETDERVTYIGSNAFYSSGVTEANFPNVKRIGSGAFIESKLQKAHISNNIRYGSYVFSRCSELSEVTIDEGIEELPQYSFGGCNKLTSIILPSTITRLNMSDWPSSLEYIGCKSCIVPTIINAVKYPTQPDLTKVTLEVPVGFASRYRKNELWSQCKEIIENNEWTAYTYGPAQNLPNGLYYAVKNGNICYFDGKTQHDTGLSSGAHPFQMQNYEKAIYVADAGETYTYTTNPYGDGLLFKMEYDGKRFFKTPIVAPSNGSECYIKGYSYFSESQCDPHTCFIDQTNGDIYMSNRNLGVLKINANERNWYEEGTVHTTNSDHIFMIPYWTAYYERGINYRAIASCFQRDKNGVNWISYFYNGQGLYRFKDSDIHPEGVNDTQNRPYITLFNGEEIKSFYIDETNDYLYVFSSGKNYGLYRIALSEIKNLTKDILYLTDIPNVTCISSDPASPENNTIYETVHVRQITGDGENIFWSYIAENGSGYKSGIKMVNATGSPEVKTIIEDVEAYGLTIVKHDTDYIQNITTDKYSLITVNGCNITALNDITIKVFNINGITEASFTASAGETITTNNLSRGIYMIVATDNAGNTQATKIAIK